MYVYTHAHPFVYTHALNSHIIHTHTYTHIKKKNWLQGMRDEVFWFKDKEEGVSMAGLACCLLSTMGAAQNISGVMKKEALD